MDKTNLIFILHIYFFTNITFEVIFTLSRKLLTFSYFHPNS